MYNYYLPRQYRSKQPIYCTPSPQPNGVVQIDSDIWISQFHNTEHSYSQHGLATPWLMLEWQGICQKHLLWTEYIVYCYVMLGSIIKWRGQSIKQGRLHVILHFAPLFKWNCRILQIILKWTENVWSCMCCASPFYLLVSLPPVLTGIKLTAEQNVAKECIFHPCTPLGDFDSCIYE